MPLPSPLPPDWFARFRLKLRHLQLLASLDETRNLNRTAEALGVTQRGGLEDIQRPGLGGELSGTIALALVERLEDRPELASHRPEV